MRAVRKVFDFSKSNRTKNILRVFPRCDRCDLKPRRQLRGQVFQAVDSKINTLLGQRLLDLFGEHALGANFGESDIENLVSGGPDDLEFDLVALLAQQRGNVIRLPERE